ncbi:unnamed protein product [Arctia plantaginis]|uniref:Uncharacterized protein n=1 Tax=Arctia plantaginis TaxID=874455 RepID=A0A8S1A054_ARCPL|nr:unnamed protein product [Arctia plantaginis]
MTPRSPPPCCSTSAPSATTSARTPRFHATVLLHLGNRQRQLVPGPHAPRHRAAPLGTVKRQLVARTPRSTPPCCSTSAPSATTSARTPRSTPPCCSTSAPSATTSARTSYDTILYS